MPLSVRSNSRTANASAVRTTASHISNALPQWAQTTGQWLSVRSVLSGASRHVPLAPGCLPETAAAPSRPAAWHRRGDHRPCGRRRCPSHRPRHQKAGRTRAAANCWSNSAPNARSTPSPWCEDGKPTRQAAPVPTPRIRRGSFGSGQVGLWIPCPQRITNAVTWQATTPRQSLENHRRVNRLHPRRRDVNGYADREEGRVPQREEEDPRSESQRPKGIGNRGGPNAPLTGWTGPHERRDPRRKTADADPVDRPKGDVRIADRGESLGQTPVNEATAHTPTGTPSIGGELSGACAIFDTVSSGPPNGETTARWPPCKSSCPEVTPMHSSAPGGCRRAGSKSNCNADSSRYTPRQAGITPKCPAMPLHAPWRCSPPRH